MALKSVYDLARFDDTLIARMLGHLQTILEGVVAHPDMRIQEVPLLTAAEQAELAGWNRPAPPIRLRFLA